MSSSPPLFLGMTPGSFCCVCPHSPHVCSALALLASLSVLENLGRLPHGLCTDSFLCVDHPLQVWGAPSTLWNLSQALPDPSVDTLSPLSSLSPKLASFFSWCLVLALVLIFHIVHLPPWKKLQGLSFFMAEFTVPRTRFGIESVLNKYLLIWSNA